MTDEKKDPREDRFTWKEGDIIITKRPDRKKEDDKKEDKK